MNKTSIKKIDYKLLIIFIAIAIQIIVMSYSDHKGGLTADSKNYLNLAQNILDGNGFFVKDLYSPTGRSYFAVWPVGYSVMVAAVASVIPVDLVLASKFLNILLIGIILYIFGKIFGKEAYVFGSLFLLDSVMRLTHRTWVQTPFITGFILLSISLFYFYHNRESLRWIAAIIFSGIFLFVNRYVGVVCLIPIGILGCYLFYKKDYRAFLCLVLGGFLILGFAILYLYVNYHYTGHLTGMERIDNPEDFGWMVKRYLSRQLEEFKIPIIASVFSFLALKYLKIKPKKSKKIYRSAGKLWPFFLFVGLSYLLFMIPLRFSIRFDDFGARMLAPATILFMIALLDYLHANSRYYAIFKKSLLGVLIISFIYVVVFKPAQTRYKGELSYLDYREKQKEKSALLEPESIVLFGDYDLIYLHDSVQPAAPFPFYGDYIYGKEYNGDFKEDIRKEESISEYVKRRCKLPITAIYIDVDNWKPKTDGGYLEIQEFVDANKGKSIVKLVSCRNVPK